MAQYQPNTGVIIEGLSASQVGDIAEIGSAIHMTFTSNQVVKFTDFGITDTSNIYGEIDSYVNSSTLRVYMSAYGVIGPYGTEDNLLFSQGQMRQEGGLLDETSALSSCTEGSNSSSLGKSKIAGSYDVYGRCYLPQIDYYTDWQYAFSYTI